MGKVHFKQTMYNVTWTTRNCSASSYCSRLPNTSHLATDVSTLASVGSQVTMAMTDQPNLTVPRMMLFTDDNLLSVVAYSVLFFIAALGNLTVFLTLFRNRHRKSRINLFIMHLSMADLIVTFVMLPMEIAWHMTVSWKAGDLACRVLMFFRPFGFYLSSFILIGISLDRYFAITQPLSLSDADKRGKIMIVLAWIFSIISSIPQSVIYHVERHPDHPWFTQCVTLNFFPTSRHELVYNLFHMAAVFGAPLVTIVISYTLILVEITRKSRLGKEPEQSETRKSFKRQHTFRRSGIGRMEKAKIRTLKMTIVIVLVFLACWTPYFVISAWWWVDKVSASKLDPKIARALFIFAVSNSCLNPIVYGLFTHTVVRELRQCWIKIVGGFRKDRSSKLSTRGNVHSTRQLLSDKKTSSSLNSHATPSAQDTWGPSSETHTHHEDQTDERERDHEATECDPINQCADVNASFLWNGRRPTPPHIAHGKGNKYQFELYMLI